MTVLDITENTINEAIKIQKEIQKIGHTLEKPDAIIAGNAKEHGATFATAEKQFWKNEIQDILKISPYK